MAPRVLRLAALRDAPDAFGSTYAEEAARPEAVWRERFLSAVSSDQHCLLFAAPEGRPCGVVWCKQTTQAYADLYQMWVAPEARGQGYGRQLLHAAADWARAQGVRQMRLSVSGGNHAARALYHAFGFRPSGERAPLRPGSAAVGGRPVADTSALSGISLCAHPPTTTPAPRQSTAASPGSASANRRCAAGGQRRTRRPPRCQTRGSH